MMHINRNNYETFFLLYVDNELTATEKESVEAFVALHPDLAEELQQIKQLTLPKETLSYTDKSTLFKTEFETEKIEELLMGKLDEELSKEESRELDLLLQQEAVKKEWEIFQQTKLNRHEYIPFENKNILYRQEVIQRRLPRRYVKWAIAAAIIGLGLFYGIRILQSNSVDKPIQEYANRNNDPAIKQPQTGTETQDNIPEVKEQRARIETLVSNETPRPSEPNIETSSIDSKEEGLQPQKGMLVFAVSSTTNAEPMVEDISLTSTMEKNLQLKQPAVMRSNPDPVLSLAANEMESPDFEPMEGLDASQKNKLAAAFAPDPEADRILYMNQAVLKETKLGKLVQKTKENISEKTQIKTGRGLRIGNFEIAIR